MKDGFAQGILPESERARQNRNGYLQKNSRQGCDVRKRLVGRAEFLLRDAFALVFFLMGARVGSMFIVAAPVQHTNLVYQANHGLMVMVRYEHREQDHHHGQQIGDYGELPDHPCKGREKLPISNV
jgi:hypothetical protein